MKKLFKSLLGAVLAGSLLITGCDSGVLAEIEQLQREQDATNASLQSQMAMINGALQAYKDIVDPSLQSLKATLEKQLADMVAADAANAGEIEALKTRISALETAMQTLKETTLPALEARIQANKDNLESFEQATAANFTAVENLLAGLQASTLPAATFNEFKNAYLTRMEGYDELKAQIVELLNKYGADIARLEGGIAANAAEIAMLKSRVQSLVFVPRYKDGKFGIPFSIITDGTNFTPRAYNDPKAGFEVVYKVSPDTLASKLAALAAQVFTFSIESELLTRALDPLEPSLTILGATGDNASGKITFKLDHEGFNAGLNGMNPVVDSYAVSLRVDEDDLGVHVASEYTLTAAARGPRVIVDMENIYREKNDGIEVAYTRNQSEYKGEIEYIDTTARDVYKGCFLAARVEDLMGTVTGPFSFDSLSRLGFKMPSPSVKIEAGVADCDYLQHAELPDGSTTVRVKKGTPLKEVKEHLVNAGCAHAVKMNYAFNDGFGGVLEMPASVTLAKAKSLDFQIAYEMKWKYSKDAYPDHMNSLGKSFSYDRANLVSVPLLVKDDMKVALDGSDAAYGIVVTDFEGKSFTKDAGATVPAAMDDYDYTVNATSAQNGTVTLAGIAIKSWGKSVAPKADTLSLKGKYVLPFAQEANATVKIGVTDRDRTPIEISLDTFPVTILGGVSNSEGGLYKASQDSYAIQSANLADTVYNRYLKQGIFAADAYSKAQVFSDESDAEFNPAHLKWANTGDAVAARFGTQISNSPAAALYLVSNTEGADDKKFTSAALKSVAQNYSATGEYQKADPAKTFTYSFYSYIGQEVRLTWSVAANPSANYMFATYGAHQKADGSYYFNISPNHVFSNPTAIKKASTELDLLWHNNVQIVSGPNGVGGIKPENFYTQGLVPVFELAETYSGVSVKAGQADGQGNKYVSNVEYYGQVDEVTVTSALYVKSGESLFFVPGSDSLYVDDSAEKIPSIAVRKRNPIAEPEEQDLQGSCSMTGGNVTLPLNMKDMNGNYIYKDGEAQDKQGNYVDTINNIFGTIVFSTHDSDFVLSYDTNPDRVRIAAPNGINPGTYSVPVRVYTLWQSYEYVFNVTVMQ